ncbi:MAG TPA: Ldh family oxidoreductase [Ramlibacter sp.]|nr:Ldh family oxidoreductase [Ramlibacter sp.]
MLVPSAALLRQIKSILSAWGMGDEEAGVVAEILVETDLRAIDSHGVSMLPMYEQMVKAGTLNMRPCPVVERDTPVVALINADAGLGHCVARRAMALACDKAAAHGIGAVSVYNSHHFGAAGIYAEMAAERGMLGLITSSARSVAVIPTRGSVPMLGTNPIAFAAPAAKNPHFLLDMATSTVAVNKVKVYALNGKTLPAGWIVDGKGQSVTDAALGLKLCVEQVAGGLLPLGGDVDTGGHKGYGLAMLAQLLGSTLAGGSFSPLRKKLQGDDVPDNIGHFCLAIDPTAFRTPGAFEADVDAIIDTLHAMPSVEDDEPVLVAGDPERAARRVRSDKGIPMPESLLSQLRAIAHRADVPYDMEVAA